MKFFAYGVHMLAPKMMSVITFAQFKGVGELMGYRLYCNKPSHKDDSGHVNIVHTGNKKDRVYGVIYEFSDSHEGTLDMVAGAEHGFERVNLLVQCGGEQIKVQGYIAKDCTTQEHTLKPYDWYKEMMLRGAKQHNLPAAYIKSLEHIDSQPDPNPNRVMIHERFLD